MNEGVDHWLEWLQKRKELEDADYKIINMDADNRTRVATLISNGYVSILGSVYKVAVNWEMCKECYTDGCGHCRGHGEVPVVTIQKVI